MNFKKNKWLIFGGVALLGYFLWKRKNKPSLKKMAETTEQDVEQVVDDVARDVSDDLL